MSSISNIERSRLFNYISTNSKILSDLINPQSKVGSRKPEDRKNILREILKEIVVYEKRQSVLYDNDLDDHDVLAILNEISIPLNKALYADSEEEFIDTIMEAQFSVDCYLSQAKT